MGLKGAAIKVKKLSHYYGKTRAVKAISFDVPVAMIFGLLGPNGAGKSTTLKMLTTLLPATHGTAEVCGFDIRHNPTGVRQHIGYVPQLLSADGDLSGYENLLLSSKLYGLDATMRKKRIHEMLDFMGLLSSKDRLVNEYSGGMIRRLEIAQALLHMPEVLFLDEPSVGLDPAARQALWKHIQEWQRLYGTTILMTTHDMDEADKLCDQVAFMHEGQIVAMETPAILKAKLGPQATLNDVFIHSTGTSLNEGGDYSNVRKTRRTISKLD